MTRRDVRWLARRIKGRRARAVREEDDDGSETENEFEYSYDERPQYTMILPQMRCAPLEKSILTSALRQQASIDNDSCALLALPAEVRNLIWKFATHNDAEVMMNSMAYCKLVACTRVCRRMRQETYTMFFASNTFSIGITELQSQQDGVFAMLFNLPPSAMHEIRTHGTVDPEADYNPPPTHFWLCLAHSSGLEQDFVSPSESLATMFQQLSFHPNTRRLRFAAHYPLHPLHRGSCWDYWRRRWIERNVELQILRASDLWTIYRYRSRKSHSAKALMWILSLLVQSFSARQLRSSTMLKIWSFAVHLMERKHYWQHKAWWSSIMTSYWKATKRQSSELLKSYCTFGPKDGVIVLLTAFSICGMPPLSVLVKLVLVLVTSCIRYSRCPVWLLNILLVLHMLALGWICGLFIATVKEMGLSGC